MSETCVIRLDPHSQGASAIEPSGEVNVVERRVNLHDCSKWRRDDVFGQESVHYEELAGVALVLG